MDRYVTAGMIKRLREARGMTQQQLAERLCVSDKAVSKWETGRGYPDVSLIAPLSDALGVSVIELFAGADVVNTNRAAHMRRGKLYVCPLCGNVIHATGEAVVSCHGITLPPLEAEPAEGAHAIRVEPVEDEWFVTLDHPMTKEHFISFVLAVRDDGVALVKLYPEGNAEARLPRRGTGDLYAYCNRHGLFKLSLN